MNTDNSDIYNKTEKTEQIVYDSFNNLVFNKDKKVIQKMLIKNDIYNRIKNLNGDILEFGVFKGASLALWLQLLKLHEPNSITKVLGFDFFDKTKLLLSIPDKKNNNLMKSVVDRSESNDILIDNIQKKCDNILKNRCILIKGDVCTTTNTFCNENPGLRIKLLYLDLDLAHPTFIVLKKLWDKIVIGGLVLLDEYAFHKWDESIGVDNFLKLIEGKYKLENTFIFSPTLIIQKIKY